MLVNNVNNNSVNMLGVYVPLDLHHLDSRPVYVPNYERCKKIMIFC